MKKRLLAILLTLSVIASFCTIGASAAITGNRFGDATVTSDASNINVRIETAASYVGTGVTAWLFNAYQLEAFEDTSQAANGFTGTDTDQGNGENDQYLWTSNSIAAASAGAGNAVTFTIPKTTCNKSNGFDFDADAAATTQDYALYVYETSGGNTTAQKFTFTTTADGSVLQPLSVNTDAITKSDATVGTALTIDLTGKVSGGSGTYDYALDSGTLPAGLTLANGKITGTPTAVTSGEVTLTVKVSDDGKAADAADKTWASDKITVKLTVGQGAASLSGPNSLTATYGDTGKTVAHTVSAGTATVSYTVATGSDVIDVATNGAVTIKKAGSATVTVSATGDANYADPANKTVNVTIAKADPDGEVEFTFDETKEDLTLADIDVDITGVVGVDGNELPGTFAFLDENGDPIDEADLADYPVLPETAYDYRFTPTDTTNYNVAENDVTFIGEVVVDDHAAYMFGTTADGKTFEPDRGMTRAEVAVMIANLDGYDKNVNYAALLTKVPADLLAEKANLEKWTDNGYNKLCYILNEGIMQGRDDGNFHPYDIITRQEMAIVLGKYLPIAPATGADQFNDLTGSAVYAEGKGYINALKAAGKIDGFPDGGYKPTQNLTRAQAAKMMNYAMDREPDIAKMKAANVTTNFDDVKTFAGNAEAEWALYNIIEASIDHEVAAYH